MWHIAKGQHIRFWMEPWIEPNIILINLIEGPLPNQELSSTVRQHLTQNMININNLPFEIPLSIVSLLRKVYVPSLQNPQVYDQII